jgi:predicted transcriptional regulator
LGLVAKASHLVTVTRLGRTTGPVKASTEQARFVQAVEEGLADAEAGRVHSNLDVIRRMRARFGRKAT